MSQEEGKIASRAAARIQHTLATVEAAAKELIEQINVDLAELHSQAGGDGGSVGGHPAMILRYDAANSIATSTKERRMLLGNFSVSLAVKDIGASRAFYEKLGFRALAGNQAQNWLILQNETSTIGLFQGMFDKNVLTFNPGWDRSGSTLAAFDDVRVIQRTLKSRGLALATEADEATSGPASLMVLDPDGNPILIDQHVPSPGK
jgi:catechol 2,3-dioxygenase-like lactoylglutathione lyase family enzyme